MARVFVDHCVATNVRIPFHQDNVRLEETLPVVTALAFLVQDEFNKLVPSVNTEEADIADRSFIVGELLSLAVNLDYADEIGRRKMFTLAREMLSQDNLPDTLIPRCLDVLVKICDTERDLIRVIVDVISELREGEGEEDAEVPGSQASTYSATPSRPRAGGPRFDVITDPEEKMKAALVDLRCLVICIAMLERINSNLVDNAVLTGLMHELVIPAVENKEEPALRDQGVICLGLIGLIDLTTASGSLSLFVNLVNKADDELQSKIVRILFDLFMVHDIPQLVAGVMTVENVWELIQFLLSQPSADVQAVAAEGTAKLILAGKVSDASMLRSLVLLYFSPESADNQALRQCLTYFFPVYCYSSSDNQRTLLSVFSESLEVLQQILEEIEGEQDMPPLSQIGLMMIDWLDPLKAVERQGAKVDLAIHLDLALEVCKSILEEESKDVRKAMVAWLSKLNLPDSGPANETRVKMLELVLGGIRDKRPLSDAISRNSLNKFSTTLLKRYPEHLEGFDAEAFAEDENEEVQALVDLIDGVKPTDDAASEAGSRRKSTTGRGRRATRDSSRETSIALTDSDDDSQAGSDDEEVIPRTRRLTRGKPMSKVIEEEEEPEEAGAEAEAEAEPQTEGEDDDVESMLDSSF
ncbi:nuclear condensing complex subunits, C-term domain-containing protein [Dioszegia hungarica]|uniref:Nuclear condensing complex subunits, C-term domain-containing protein n=1 Tax=Dioszegia hungarica TaxID=4972 RepID=A0AA38LQL6_9TREE|nr:nuclear condensing complex subunits, C-term domain-containing protein [Dioszegia hungarica]KAI9633507.1 nuclear condensing complex subunits, C-term domain-containing protein [Dioszegia hungarica]